MNERYIIRAEDRVTKKRIKIAGPMSLNDAQSWKPTSLDKKVFRYFKIAKYVIDKR